MSNRARLVAAALLACLVACDKAPVEPVAITGTFRFAGSFETRVTEAWTASASGVVITRDSTAVSGSFVVSVLMPASFSEWSLLTVEQCSLCPAFASPTNANRGQVGDSLFLNVGVSPNLTLRGVYRGDSISGVVTATENRSGEPHLFIHRGRFVAKRTTP